VQASTMPRLIVGGAPEDPVVALAARWEDGALVPAGAPALDADDVVLGEMQR